MTESNSYKPIGGILRAELFPVAESVSAEQVLQQSAVEVELWDYTSIYQEVFSVVSGQVSVRHALTLVASAEQAAAWLDEEFQRRAAIEGLVARLHLSSGETLLVGVSSKFNLEQALRLDELRYSSGSSPATTPLVTLSLVSYDTQSARNNPIY